MFDAKNPVNWLFNERAEAPTAPRPCVELFGGDRLPGQVIGYRYGTELPVERQHAHLLVKLDPDAVQSPYTQVRVRAEAVRKVVWQPRRSDRYTPAQKVDMLRSQPAPSKPRRAHWADRAHR